jgi:hypothetical protein
MDSKKSFLNTVAGSFAMHLPALSVVREPDVPAAYPNPMAVPPAASQFREPTLLEHTFDTSSAGLSDST